MKDQEASPATLPFLHQNSDMAVCITQHDWCHTPLGAPQTWPPSLQHTLSLMLHSCCPMFLYWGEEGIQFYNDAYIPTLGDSGRHPLALGQRGRESWPPETWVLIEPTLRHILNTGKAVMKENEFSPVFRGGRWEDAYWTFCYSAIIGEAAKPAGVLVVCTETSKIVVANEELKKTKEELEGVIEAAELGTFDIDMTTQKVVCNRQMMDWYGVANESEATVENMIKAVAEWDRERVTAEVKQLFAVPADGVITMTYSLVHPKNPQPRHVHSRGKIKYNEGGRAVQFAGTVEDITNETNAAEAVAAGLRQLEEAYEQIRLSKEAAALGMFDMDLKLGTMEWDTRCRELFGISHDGPVSYEHDFLPGLHPEDKDRIGRLIDNLFIKEISNGDYDVEYRTVGFEDGKIRWVRAKGKVFFNEKNEAVRFIGSVLDITDSKRDEERKNTFVGMVSHELKTPLTTITAYIQMLKGREQPGRSEWEARALEKTEAQLVRMRSLVDGFLNLSRLEAGKIVLNKEVFVLPDLIREVIDETTLTTTTHPIVFHPGLPLKVYADRIKIGNVVSNLISNAIKYSDRGKHIHIWCRQIEGSIETGVRDEGIGLHRQDLHKLFTRFYRVQNNLTHNISGFGIGLYLCAEIVERHGGKIWVDSEVNRGSTFYFTLPLE